MQLTLGRIVRMSAITSGSDVKSVECMRSVMGIRSKPYAYKRNPQQVSQLHDKRCDEPAAVRTRPGLPPEGS
eukprot:scaffold1348_cov323-Prasinococcus_capsulatus_cf.AAC.8